MPNTATHCSALQRTVGLYLHVYGILWALCVEVHTATHCNTLQRPATHCNALQHTAGLVIYVYGVLRALFVEEPVFAFRRSRENECVAACCSVLQ